MKRVAIVTPQKDAYSETFIQAHGEMLRGVVGVLYGGLIPTKLANGDTLLDHPRLSERLAARLVGSQAESAPVRGVKKYLRQAKIDLILAEYGPTGEAMLPIARSLNIPMVVHFHGYDASMRQFVATPAYYAELFKYASHIVVVSRAMEEKLTGIGAPRDRILYAPYGPRTEFFDIAPNYTSKTFLSVGRFVDKKAPQLTVLAFKEVLSAHPDARLVMAGDGPLRNCVATIVDGHNLQTSIVLLGAVSHQRVKELMAQAMCFVQHSITADNGDSEGTPVGILEAQAAGLPVVSTRHAGIPDVVMDGRTGFLVAERDVAGMASRMTDLLSNPALARQLGEAGRTRVRDHFTMARHIGAIQRLIDAI